MTSMIGLATWLAAMAASVGAVPSSPNPTVPAFDQPATVAESGSVVFRDPATGRPTSVPPEGVTFSQLSPTLALDQPVEKRRTASGAWTAAVPDYLQSYAVVFPGADGRPVWTCVEGVEPLPPIVAPRVDAQGLELE
ncbi:MAG: hypothetical protein K8H90_02040 [Thermoanaerobaculia bacterium]|nr:hypothetical protein [Thermoanaerobaculia bacterium]